MSETNASRQSEEQTRADGASRSKWTWIVPVAFVVLLIGLYFLWPGFHTFVDKAYALLLSGDRQGIKEWVRGFGLWGPLTIIGFMIAQTIVAVIPSVLIIGVAVLVYGSVWGGLLAWGGLMVAATVGYGIGRAFGPVTVDKMIGHKAERKVANFVKRYGFWGIMAFRFAPALSDDAVSLVAGLIKMGYLRFLLASALGLLPLVALIAVLGESIDQLKSGIIWISVLSIAAFVAYVIYDHRRQR